MAEDHKAPPGDKAWRNHSADRFIGRTHPVGDFLEAYDWEVLEHSPGRYRVKAHLPSQVKNPRGELFGGFTPVYVDLIAVRTAHTLNPAQITWVATLNLRIDYFEPVTEDHFILVSHVVRTRGKNHLVEIRLESLSGELLCFAIVTLRER